MACPSCDAKRAVVESGHALCELLPGVAYRQWVLVLPKRLRYFVHRDARLCDTCGGTMEPVAFILGDAELTRVLKHQGWPVGWPRTMPSRAPPALEADAGCQVDPREDAWDGPQDFPTAGFPA